MVNEEYNKGSTKKDFLKKVEKPLCHQVLELDLTYHWEQGFDSTDPVKSATDFFLKLSLP